MKNQSFDRKYKVVTCRDVLWLFHAWGVKKNKAVSGYQTTVALEVSRIGYYFRILFSFAQNERSFSLLSEMLSSLSFPFYFIQFPSCSSRSVPVLVRYLKFRYYTHFCSVCHNTYFALSLPLCLLFCSPDNKRWITRKTSVRISHHRQPISYHVIYKII